MSPELRTAGSGKCYIAVFADTTYLYTRMWLFLVVDGSVMKLDISTSGERLRI
jgi:hypothetical protein